MNTRIIVSIALVTLGIVSFKMIQHPKGAAQAEQVGGLYVFTQSTPVAETVSLGTLESHTPWLESDEEIIRAKVRKARQKFPEAEGIIINADGSAEVVKFR